MNALSEARIREILRLAKVPEHSVPFMRAVSGGEAFCRQDFLFLHAEDWLMGIGYPLREAGPPAEDARAFENALHEAVQQVAAAAVFVVAPQLPESLRAFESKRDSYYTLDAATPVPRSLRGPLAKAAARLTVTEDRIFGPAHRRLWAEFLARAKLPPEVRELYARTEAALAASELSARAGAASGRRPLPDLRLLSAADGDGRAAAALLLDYSPEPFISYIIGAHSREHYTPHAPDLLFASLLERARAENKYIHLGLGVNEGIARFKRKWGGTARIPYYAAARKSGETRAARAGADGEIGAVLQNFLKAPGASKQQIFDSLPKQRSFAMIFELRKGDARSYLCGSAHFFRYSFEFSFRRLFETLHTVLFEGPLDEDFLAAVERNGRAPLPGSPRVAEYMTEEEISRLERAVYGPEGGIFRLLGLEQPRRVNVRELLAETRPWFAFFTIWVARLERLGWHQSVDIEAWRVARDMGKAAVGMENLKEQLASLESVPIARITDFFRRCREWPRYAARNVKTYLRGDLRRMMGSSIEFPTRTESVVNLRDLRFRERMRPFLERGDCAVFVGAAHLAGLIPLLERDGFTVRRSLKK
jgi:hypothetical protein